MEQLRDKYADRDVEFVPVYVREPHAGEHGFKDYRNHESFEHKRSYAEEVVKVKDLKTPVAVDGMDQQTHAILGDLPNVVYVADKSGTIVYKAPWLDAAEVDQVLAELVSADDPGRPVWPTVETKHLGSAI